ncbi:hypothetical protein I7I48_09236 [Histoplasma ohiense]|nr:hypothetical protein I7I48_09236 [Histoplasma ohiense (nom. inval.)]
MAILHTSFKTVLQRNVEFCTAPFGKQGKEAGMLGLVLAPFPFLLFPNPEGEKEPKKREREREREREGQNAGQLTVLDHSLFLRMITRDLVLAHNVVTRFIGADEDIDSKRTREKGQVYVSG